MIYTCNWEAECAFQFINMATNARYSSEEFSSDENFCDDSSDSGGDTSDGTVIYDVPVRFLSILEI